MVGARSPIETSPVPQTTVPARSGAVKAAQKAFFQAALNGSSAAAPQAAIAAVAPVAAVAATPVRASVKPQALDPDNPPSRPLRPGSLLDITV
jgi:hypothetical protein